MTTLLSLVVFIVTGIALGADIPKPAIQLSHDDPRVGTYVSTGPGFFTSSYWIEGPDGLVVIDTQFLLSSAEELIAWAEKTTGKKIKLAIVLHPNPDKFNGTSVFQKHGIKVVTSEEVKRLIPSVHQLRYGWFYDDFKPDYPKASAEPEAFGSQTQEISAAGLTLKAHVMGKGCSDAHVVVEWEGHLFPGDLVTNNFHSWLELGYVDEWLKRVHEMQALEPQFVHPGRGPAGGGNLLTMEAAYLQKVREIFLAAHPRKISDPDQLEARLSGIEKKILAAYPGYLYPRFVENGLEATWNALAGPARGRTKTQAKR